VTDEGSSGQSRMLDAARRCTRSKGTRMNSSASWSRFSFVTALVGLSSACSGAGSDGGSDEPAVSEPGAKQGAVATVDSMPSSPSAGSPAGPSSMNADSETSPTDVSDVPIGGAGSMLDGSGGGAEATPMNEPAEGSGGLPTDGSCDSGVVDEVYDRYVAPLVEGGQPSSCNQCHLSGVNLGNFVQGTPCESMACLMQNGEVDLDDPSNSKILQRIQLADPASGLITERVVDREYEGFLAWIEYSARCQSAACGEIPNACGGEGSALDTPSGPLGECTEGQLADQFERSVYSTLSGRCAGCHDPDGPKFEEDAILWLDLRDGGALRTMYNLVGRGALNTETVDLSLLLIKPLAEAAGGVPHGGGDKYANTDDATYVETKRWIEAYARCKNTGDLGDFPEAPTVSIVTPQPGEVRENPVRLDGIAIDAQEGQLVDTVRWESNVDGVIGSQNVVAGANLSPGSHTLTFTARDSDGNTVSASVMISVQ
jgi:hypothetical protein